MKIHIYILFALCSVQLAFAEGGALVNKDALIIKDAWARPVIIAGRPGAAYLGIDNATDKDDKLLKASSTLTDHIELHVHKHDNGVMTMEQVPHIVAPAHHLTMIEPGGFHLMLFGLSKKLAEGDTLPLTLVFEHAGEIHVTAKVMKKAPKMEMPKDKIPMDKMPMDPHMDHSKMSHTN